MKYKVGDKVRVREDLVPHTWHGSAGIYFHPDMEKYKGMIVTVKSISGDWYYSMEETETYAWTDEMLEDYNVPYLISKELMKEYRRLWNIMFGEEKEKDMKEFFIKNYKVCDNNGIKTLVVDFEDGTKERAVCCPEDPFELQRGLEICVLKHILGRDNYKAMLKTAMKQVKAIDKAAEEAKKEKEMIAAKKASAARKKARYKANKRKQRIAEMKEAYVAAMQECGHVDISLDDLK